MWRSARAAQEQQPEQAEEEDEEKKEEQEEQNWCCFAGPGGSLTSGQTDGPTSRSASSSSLLLPVNYALLFFVNALVDENPALMDEKP